MSYKVYSKKRNHSYTWGAFPTFELIENRPDLLERVLIHSKTDPAIVADLLRRADPSLIVHDDPLLEKLAHRENVYVLGVFRPDVGRLTSGNHVVLDQPSNFGNLGTILRTALGLGFQNIALIGPACDVNHPQVIRAAMGAHFSLNIENFSDFESYLARFPNQSCFAFMGGSDLEVSQIHDVRESYSLFFGNESRGLPESVKAFATPVSIAMSSQIDSYNITIAAAIGMYSFHQKRPINRP